MTKTNNNTTNTTNTSNTADASHIFEDNYATRIAFTTILTTLILCVTVIRKRKQSKV
ncbi:MAG: hypothetical protein ACXAD7_15760 [Candidatus Kariarchaeaceae archaeon]|jgi:hypothetical protein